MFDYTIIKILTVMTLVTVGQLQTPEKMKQLTKNKMSVKWQIEGDLIHFEMEAPTNGWVAIGFNETDNLTGAYLLMGRIIGTNPEVVEHFTALPGSYQPIQNYGPASQVKNISGHSSEKQTLLKFSIPTTAASRYHKNLKPDSRWILIMAYSLDEDFQHHSIMRTSAKIHL